MEIQTTENLLLQIEKLQNRLTEADQLIELIKAGEVDAFALNKNNKPEVFTLQSADYAYRVLVENFSEGALNLSQDGLILYANTSFHEILQLSHEKVIGQNISQFIHPHSKETFNQLLTKGLDGKSKGEINLMVGNKACPVYVSLASLYPDLPTVGIIVSNLTERKQIEKELEVKKNLQNIFQNAPAAIAIYEGPECKYILANKGYEKLTNSKAADLLGKSFKDVFPELKNTGMYEIYDHVFKTGEPFIAPEYAAMLDIKNDGELRQGYFNFSMEPLKNDAGEIYAIVAMTYDITEQVVAKRKIEESERDLRQILDSMPQKITNADTEGNIIYINKKWMDDTGLEFEKLKGWGWEKVIHPDDLEVSKKKSTNSFQTGDIFDMECRILNKEGEYRWHLSRSLPIKDENGKIKMWVGTNTEIHEQKEAMSKAEAAMKAKQQFLSNMSHEIRTPLNSILGFTNVLLKTDLGEKQKDFVQAIKTSSSSLNVLINDILDLAKVDAGKITFVKQPFDMHKSIRSILHSFDLKVKEKNLELVSEYDSEIPLVVIGDSVRLNQIILNLMSNAVKFTHKGKITLNIKLQSEDEENVSIEFAITDSGIGIAADKIDSIFNLFEQAEISTSNSYGGTGLGLAIVKQLVEFQGGTIRVNSKIDEGSTFRFTLSFGKTNMKIVEEVEILKLDSKIKNLRVLVAEDVALNQLLIKIILSDFGFEHEVVNNGKIAIEKLQTNTYDIVLMDLQMPEMDGFEATEYIRKTIKSDIPIIALTADVTTVNVAKCKEFGMDAYISKPIDENQLYSKITELINNNY